jgi:hypothetical protein
MVLLSSFLVLVLMLRMGFLIAGIIKLSTLCSYPGAHAQNGVAKPRHHHILETARVLMLDYSIPPHFWVDSVSTITYLISIHPSSIIQHDYSSLHRFGCVCYVLLAPHEHTKLTVYHV